MKEKAPSLFVMTVFLIPFALQNSEGARGATLILRVTIALPTFLPRPDSRICGGRCNVRFFFIRDPVGRVDD